MLYVKVVTPLVLKWWVWPTIKCSHLIPQSIYSYIDDLLIANFLIDARSVCACFVTYFICYLIVWACWLHNFLHSRTFICCFDCLIFLLAKWMDECLSTPSSYLCFSRLKLYSCYITMFEQVEFGPFGWGAPKFRSDQHPSCEFRSDQHTHIRSHQNH